MQYLLFKKTKNKRYLIFVLCYSCTNNTIIYTQKPMITNILESPLKIKSNTSYLDKNDVSAINTTKTNIFGKINNKDFIKHNQARKRRFFR